MAMAVVVLVSGSARLEVNIACDNFLGSPL